MLAYLREESISSNRVRLGRISDGNGWQVALPAVAPEPRLPFESRAVRKLLAAGADAPVLLIPLSTRKDVLSEIAPVVPDPRQRKLLPDDKPVATRLILPNVESEAFAYPNEARRAFLAGRPRPPARVGPLLQSLLKGDRKRGRKETTDAWESFHTEWGPSVIGEWMGRLQAQARSPIFIAPSPIVRAVDGSADLSFQIGWSIADALQEDTPFQGRGIEVPVHSEVFLDGDAASKQRQAVLANLGKLYGASNPRHNPYVALKIIDRRSLLTNGPQQAVALTNLKDLLCQSSEHLARADGVFIVHNLGPWAIAGLDCSVDVVGTRGTGQVLEVDEHFGPRPKKGQRRRRVLSAERPRRHREVSPFDPIRLADYSSDEAAKMWAAHQSMKVPAHVPDGVEWAQLAYEERREFRAQLVFGSLLEIGTLFRNALAGRTPLSQCVRDREGRLAFQDVMQFLSPSYEESI